MLFSSFTFLGFFAVVVAAYYALPHRFRWVLLLIASAYFYSTYKLSYLVLLGYAALVAWGGGLWVARARERSRAPLVLAVLAELGVLVLFKYVDFLAGAAESLIPGMTLPRLDWLLPAGLSFYVFSAISYLIDVQRGTIGVERHAGRLALYVAFFPKLLAGPIERAGSFLAQLDREVVWNPAAVAAGLQLMLWGLFKKVVIADRLASFVATGFGHPEFQSPVAVLVAVYFYAFQIYCDFSGYSDIAIGAALVLGFRLMENFRRPYLARSVPEFWNSRWHLSLMRWFRDYLYIPLGGNRVPAWRRYLNVMIVFGTSGLWHGAAWTFLLWGALNGLYQAIYMALAAPRRWLGETLPTALMAGLSILLTFHLVGFAWIFFRASDIDQGWSVVTRIAGAIPQLPTQILRYGWTGEHFLSLGLILLLIGIEALEERRPISERLANAPVALRWAFFYAVAAALLVIGVWGNTGFVYMSF